MADTSIPGRIEPRPNLAALAMENILPDSTPILAAVFPDTRVPMFKYRAPKSVLGSRLLVVADDTIGRDTKMIEEDIEVSHYEGEIGMHGRQRTIPFLDIMRAQDEATIARAQGEDVDPMFDLEAFHTADMIRKNQLHNELLGGLEMLDQDNYPDTHKWGVAGGVVTDPIDVVNEPNIRELLFDASAAIQDDGVNLPPTVTVIGVGARRGLQKNPAFLNLLPEDAIKRLTEDDLLQILEMPNGSRIVFPNIRVQYAAGAQPVPLIDNFIGVYRVVPATDRVNATWGRNFYRVDPRNNQRVYVNQQTVGVAETRVLGLFNWYRVQVVYPELGAMMITESNPIEP